MNNKNEYSNWKQVAASLIMCSIGLFSGQLIFAGVFFVLAVVFTIEEWYQNRKEITNE
jgi:hypothetical protein